MSKHPAARDCGFEESRDQRRRTRHVDDSYQPVRAAPVSARAKGWIYVALFLLALGAGVAVFLVTTSPDTWRFAFLAVVGLANGGLGNGAFNNGGLSNGVGAPDVSDRSVCDLVGAYLFSTLRTKHRAFTERDSTMSTASGNFGLRHRRLQDFTLVPRV